MFSPVTGARPAPAVNPAKAQPLKFKGDAPTQFPSVGDLVGKNVIWDGSHEAVGAQAALEKNNQQGIYSGPFRVTRDYFSRDGKHRLIAIQDQATGAEDSCVNSAYFNICTS